jgi:hypothetical protein
MRVKPRTIEELTRDVAAGTVRCNQFKDSGKRCRETAVAVCVCGDVACEGHKSLLVVKGEGHGEPVR